MSVLKFTWNGVSSDSYGVEVLRLPGAFIAAERITEVTVPGRSGQLHISDGAMDEQVLQIDCYLPYSQGGTVATVQNIAKWLRGSGVLMMSSSMETSSAMFKYKARVVNGITTQHVVPGFDDCIFSITFYAEPYKYANDFDTWKAITATKTFAAVNNYANWEPVYKLQTVSSGATGTGTLKVMKGSTELYSITGSSLTANKIVTIDVPNKIITMDGEIVTDNFTGEWPAVPAESFAANEVLSFAVSGDFQTSGSTVQWNARCY